MALRAACRLALALLSGAAACACVASTRPPAPETLRARSLPFRAILQGYPAPDDPVFWDRGFWSARLSEWSREGLNAVVWFGPGELTTGEQLLLRHERYPEARELPVEESGRRIDQMRWLFEAAHEAGLQNLLLSQHLFFTEAFGRRHGLLDPRPVSPEVTHRHNEGYPDLWRSGRRIRACGVRNDLTTAYTRAVYEELIATYPALDGFYGMLGEPLPGRRSAFFREAIAPALRASGRRPLFLACQWQVPLDDFLADVAPREVYDRVWLGFHGYNSEQITDAKPYPGVVEWSERTGLPTVVEIYPANVQWFPWNSPRLAYEIADEMKRVEGVAGFIYAERFVSGTRLGPLFRKALARYAQGSEPYSEDPWLEELEKEFGDRAAALHFLRAYDVGGRILPETCALLYSGGDVIRREL
ncbi:MAG TPA: hypothetical protein VKF62_07555, partial [Planctomycetota bacterium]|nr:hypothetical protein [Planctomycetota bacterium]